MPVANLRIVNIGYYDVGLPDTFKNWDNAICRVIVVAGHHNYISHRSVSNTNFVGAAQSQIFLIMNRAYSAIGARKAVNDFAGVVRAAIVDDYDFVVA